MQDRLNGTVRCHETDGRTDESRWDEGGPMMTWHFARINHRTLRCVSLIGQNVLIISYIFALPSITHLGILHWADSIMVEEVLARPRARLFRHYRSCLSADPKVLTPERVGIMECSARSSWIEKMSRLEREEESLGGSWTRLVSLLPSLQRNIIAIKPGMSSINFSNDQPHLELFILFRSVFVIIR